MTVKKSYTDTDVQTALEWIEEHKKKSGQHDKILGLLSLGFSICNGIPWVLLFVFCALNFPIDVVTLFAVNAISFILVTIYVSIILKKLYKTN